MPTHPTFDERFGELAQIAHRVAFRLTGSRDDTEDLTQEALARTAVRWRRVEPYADAFVARVTTNLALGLLRRRRELPHTIEHRGDLAQRVVDRDELVRALRKLPRRQREVLALRFLADLSEARVAEVLGCSVGTVKQHTHRAVRAARALLAHGSDPNLTNPDPGGPSHVPTSG